MSEEQCSTCHHAQRKQEGRDVFYHCRLWNTPIKAEYHCLRYYSIKDWVRHVMDSAPEELKDLIDRLN